MRGIIDYKLKAVSGLCSKRRFPRPRRQLRPFGAALGREAEATLQATLAPAQWFPPSQ
jgi:hypothetical protein